MINIIKKNLVDCTNLTKELEDEFKYFEVNSDEDVEKLDDKVEDFITRKNKILDAINNLDQIRECLDSFVYKKSMENSIC